MSVSADLGAALRRIDLIDGMPSPFSSRSAPSTPSGSLGEPQTRGAHTFGALVAGAAESLARLGGREAGVDPALVTAVMQTESGFDPHATSQTGAAGLMQLMPATARELGVADPYDPVQNVRGGAAYLHQLLERFHGDVPLAVAAYNAGPGAVERYGGVPPYAETRDYVGRVLAAYRARGDT